MSDLYNMLCVVRTSMLNVIGQMYLDNRPRNLPALLKSIGSEISELMDHEEFVDAILDMTEDQLLDLGFDYLNNESIFMLIPAWLFPIIPEGVELETVGGVVFTLEEDSVVSLRGDSWVDVGFHIPEVDINR